MSPLHPNLQSALICFAYSGTFALLQTLSSNRDEGARGRALAWLIFVNVLCGIGGGLLVTPALTLIWPANPLEARMVLSALAGYFGLDYVMRLLKIQAERKLPHGTPHLERPDQGDRLDHPGGEHSHPRDLQKEQ